MGGGLRKYLYCEGRRNIFWNYTLHPSIQYVACTAGVIGEAGERGGSMKPEMNTIWWGTKLYSFYPIYSKLELVFLFFPSPPSQTWKWIFWYLSNYTPQDLIGMSIKDMSVCDRIISIRELFQANNEGIFWSTCP